MGLEEQSRTVNDQITAGTQRPWGYVQDIGGGFEGDAATMEDEGACIRLLISRKLTHGRGYRLHENASVVGIWGNLASHVDGRARASPTEVRSGELYLARESPERWFSDLRATRSRRRS